MQGESYGHGNTAPAVDPDFQSLNWADSPSAMSLELNKSDSLLYSENVLDSYHFISSSAVHLSSYLSLVLDFLALLPVLFLHTL